MVPKYSTKLDQIESNTADDTVQMQYTTTNVIQSTNNATIPVQMRRNEAENDVQMRDNAVDSVVQTKNSSANRLVQMQNYAGGNSIQVRNSGGNGPAGISDSVAKPPVEMQNVANPALIRNSGDTNAIQARDSRTNSPEGHRQTIANDESREEQGREILQSMLMARRTGGEGIDSENGSSLQASVSKPAANRSSLFPDSMSRCNGNVRPIVTVHKDEAGEVNANEMGVLKESDVEDYAEDAEKAIKADIDKLLDDFMKRADQALGEKTPTRRSEVAVSAQLSRGSSPSASPGESAVSDARHVTSSCDEEVTCDARHAPTSTTYPIQSSQVPWQRPGRISRERDSGRASSESTPGLLVPWAPPRRLGKPVARNMPAGDRSAGVDSTAEEKEVTVSLTSSSSACDRVEAQDNSLPSANVTSTGGVQQVSWRTPSRLGSVRRGQGFQQKSPIEVGAHVPADALRLPLHIAEALGDETQGVSSIAPASSASIESPRVPWKQPCRLASPAQRSHVVTPSVSLSSTGLQTRSHSQGEDAEGEIIQDASLRMDYVEGSPRETDDCTVDQFELLLQRSRLEYPAREEDEKEEVTAAAAAAAVAARTCSDAAPSKANEHARKQGGDAARVKKEPKDTEATKGDQAGDTLQCHRADDEHDSVDRTPPPASEHAKNQGKDSALVKEECQEATVNKDGRANGFQLVDGAVDEHSTVNAAPPKAQGHAVIHLRSKQKHCERTAGTNGRSAGMPRRSGAVGIQDSANVVSWKAEDGAGKGDNVARPRDKHRNVAVKKGGGTESILPRDAAVSVPGLKKGNNGICSGGFFVSSRRRDSSSPSSRAGSKSGSLDRGSNSSFAHRRGRDDIERPRNRERHSTSTSRRRRDDRFGHRSRESTEGKGFRKRGERGYERDDFGRKTKDGSKGRSERRKRESSRRRASSSEEDRKPPHDRDRCDWSGRRRWARSRSPQR